MPSFWWWRGWVLLSIDNFCPLTCNWTRQFGEETARAIDKESRSRLTAAECATESPEPIDRRLRPSVRPASAPPSVVRQLVQRPPRTSGARPAALRRATISPGGVPACLVPTCPHSPCCPVDLPCIAVSHFLPTSGRSQFVHFYAIAASFRPCQRSRRRPTRRRPSRQTATPRRVRAHVVHNLQGVRCVQDVVQKTYPRRLGAPAGSRRAPARTPRSEIQMD